MTTGDLQLLDYRRQVNEHYAALRTDGRALKTRHTAFRSKREALFAAHPQSALDEPQRERFDGLPYYPYDPDLRVLVDLDYGVTANLIEVPLNAHERFRMRRFALARFDVAGHTCALSLFWIEGYGGGLFLPFRDPTAEQGLTYGGGRYLIDSIKGADLGLQDDKLVFDFNFAYNPSCAYHSRWSCPLAPAENWLDVPIQAGELAYPDRQ